MTKLEECAMLIAEQTAFRPWADMAEDRAELRKKIRIGYDMGEATRSDCRDAARSVLDALRDPDESMLAAAFRQPTNANDREAELVWQAMIDQVAGQQT